MSTSGQAVAAGLSAGLKEVLASSLTTLGRFHNEEYVLNRHCLESVKDVIRFLRRDNESHEIRRYLGQAKVVQSDLIHIVKSCPPESESLLELTVRLLMNLTNPIPVLYRDELPAEKLGRSIYMTLIEHLQDYKEAFSDIDFWNVICGKLTDLFETDWSERSEDDGLRIERMLVLLRNVLHIPADPEREKITENDISVHDKILWSLRQSQILEFLLYVSSNKAEQKYYLHLLEIFSLILREQNPKLLAASEIQRSEQERRKDTEDLVTLREREKLRKMKYKNMRTFDSTVVLKGFKSFSGRDMIYHGTLTDMRESIVPRDKKRGRPRNRRVPVESENPERRSSFSVRIFLKEFCIEFLNCSYNNLMSVAKEKLAAGKGLPNDEAFYFWALKFFLEFNCAYNMDIKLISDSVNVQTFHFLQTSMEENFENLATEKKRTSLWVRKLHLILKAYHSLLQTLKWMDASKDSGIREMSEVLKSQVFYVAEYRDMALSFLTRYDSDVFSAAYARDAVEAAHLSFKLLEEYTKRNKIVVRKRMRKKAKRRSRSRRRRRAKAKAKAKESSREKWERIQEEARRVLTDGTEFPDVTPFDVLLELTDEEQKERTMRNVQRMLREGRVVDGIGLLRSARNAWPENDHFGSGGMSPEEEWTALREICLAELGNEEAPSDGEEEEEEEDKEEADEADGSDDGDDDDDDNDDDDDEGYRVSEQGFDIMDYKKQLVNKKVVEVCGVLLQNYSKNSDYTNHCVVKLLFRIGWECSMPAMMYQVSLFWTLLKIMNDKYKTYKEINDFTVHLMRKFREDATRNKFAFVELLFWKDPTVALEIQGEKSDGDVAVRGRKAASWSAEEEDELRRLWTECTETSLRKKIRWIKSSLIDESKSLKSVRMKLAELGLAEPEDARVRVQGKEWTYEEVEELRELFGEFREAMDVVSILFDRLTLKRTKKSIRAKLLELGLLKKGRRKRAKADEEDGDSEEEEEGEGEDSIVESRTFTRGKQREAVKAVDVKRGLEWLKDIYVDYLGEEEKPETVTLIALEPHEIEALESKSFVEALRRLGWKEPEPGRVFWTCAELEDSDARAKVKLLEGVLAGEESADESEDEFAKLKKLTEKSKDKFEGLKKRRARAADGKAEKSARRKKGRKVGDDGNEARESESAVPDRRKNAVESGGENDFDGLKSVASGRRKKFAESADRAKGPKKRRNVLESDDEDLEDEFDKLKSTEAENMENVLESDDDDDGDDDDDEEFDKLRSTEPARRKKVVESDDATSAERKNRKKNVLESDSEDELFDRSDSTGSKNRKQVVESDDEDEFDKLKSSGPERRTKITESEDGAKGPKKRRNVLESDDDDDDDEDSEDEFDKLKSSGAGMREDVAESEDGSRIRKKRKNVVESDSEDEFDRLLKSDAAERSKNVAESQNDSDELECAKGKNDDSVVDSDDDEDDRQKRRRPVDSDSDSDATNKRSRVM